MSEAARPDPSPAEDGDAPSGPPDFDPAAHPRKLNLGCGFDKRSGYLNVDFQAFHEPDLVADVRHLPMLPDGYYAEIVAQDVLEHLTRADVEVALAEWGRKLEVGGRLVLRVPDVLGVARLLSRNREVEQQRTLIQNLFGTQAYDGDYHLAGFTEVTLRASLADAGFEVVEIGYRDGWMFDVVARRVAGRPEPDLSRLEFMDVCIGQHNRALLPPAVDRFASAVSARLPAGARERARAVWRPLRQRLASGGRGSR